MKTADFHFDLPEQLIAQHPLPARDQSRMMVVRRSSGTWEHRRFAELPDIVAERYFLVVNNTRVVPARLRGRREPSGGAVELLLLSEKSPGRWLALLRPAGRLRTGDRFEAGGLRGVIDQVRPNGMRLVVCDAPEAVREALERRGEPPLPPYIRRRVGEPLDEDRERYQTVFAAVPGSIAAPTAALHFTPEVLERLERRGVPRVEIVLHVGYGTFQPVRSEEVEDHRLEPEYFEVGEPAAEAITRHRSEGRRLLAVGTTTTRTLEHLARSDGTIRAASGWSDLFIYPGFGFRAAEGLLTNFHLPGSTLLMLVCAFAGRELVLEAYRDAIREEYRFFSYGDCMLLL